MTNIQKAGRFVETGHMVRIKALWINRNDDDQVHIAKGLKLIN